MLVDECPLWEYPRHNFELLAPELRQSRVSPEFVLEFSREFISSQVASTPEELTAFVLVGVPPSLHGALDFIGVGPSLFCLFCCTCSEKMP